MTAERTVAPAVRRRPRSIRSRSIRQTGPLEETQVRLERWLVAASLLMLYWIAGFAGIVVGAAVFYGYLMLTARPDPYEGSGEALYREAGTRTRGRVESYEGLEIGQEPV